MLPVANRPILDVTVDHLAHAGIERVFVVIGHLADQIEEHFRLAAPPVPQYVEKASLGAGRTRRPLPPGSAPHAHAPPTTTTAASKIRFTHMTVCPLRVSGRARHLAVRPALRRAARRWARACL